jgi:predicted metal-dependent enzyme (double-stranded beta helix superfamily)
MSLAELQTYVAAASADREIGVHVYSIDTGDEIALTYDVVADISEYGELLISVAVEYPYISNSQRS